MLSRVAESLYWTARYLERAEDVTRLLDVNFHGLLDSPSDDRGDAWRRIVRLLGDSEAFAEHFDEATAQSVGEWVLWHDGNPNAVVSCVTLARENARSVREQISGEMWEAINKVFLLVRGANRRAVSRGPSHVLRAAPERHVPLPGRGRRDDDPGRPLRVHSPWPPSRTCLEDGEDRALRVPVGGRPDRGRSRADAGVDLLLKCCGAWEAFVRRHGTRCEPVAIAEDLIRSRELPRSVLYCLTTCRDAVARLSSEPGAPHRVLGRLCAELEYADVGDVSGATIDARLGDLLTGIHTTGEAITKAYFSSRTLPAASLATQEAQQQQCG